MIRCDLIPEIRKLFEELENEENERILKSWQIIDDDCDENTDKVVI
jgi:hypothetical protein